MSKPGFKIHFDEPPPPLRPDVVTLAVAPMDAFSGRLVTSGVKASVKDLLDRPIRNLSGHLVFKNLLKKDKYTVAVDPTEAGYFVPDETVFSTPPPPRTRENTLHPIWLMRRPEFPFESDITMIRGVVVNGKDGVDNATVFVNEHHISGPHPGKDDFQTRTDHRGAFALALRLPPPENRKPEFHTQPGKRDRVCVTVQLHVRKGNIGRDLACTIAEGKSNSLLEPIDLSGTDSAEFFDPCKPRKVDP